MNSKVTPWEVQGEVDYDKLIQEFGTKKIDKTLKEKLLNKMKEGPNMISRDFFFSHRDLDIVLKDHTEGKGFFLYTGRGPSGQMHLGHVIPLLFTKYLQDAFDVNLYIQITDDEKFLYNRERTWNEIKKNSEDNIRNIAALGFNPNKTFIFRDSEYIKNIYPLILKTARKITFSTAKAVFGFTNETSIGMINYPASQIVPTFFEKKRCLIPSAIDQDPYWRIQRDIAETLGYYKTAAIHSKFFPPLTGVSGKMSSSIKESAVWLTDDEKTVKKKINKYAFSGGKETVEEHRKKGGEVSVDVSFQWLDIFFEPDDKRLKEIKEEYTSGSMLTGELKEILIGKVNTFLEKHREAVEKVDVEAYLYKGKLAKEMWDKNYE
ncbi:tryptophan--tRNA ligase [Candidatus Micrarchaeota archaeon]|nr:tryptophan--tRNA ligase [Candidatus Micrarchaeota archaeon]